MLRTRRAFSLVEMVVVIAIISVLAAILFPVFAAAKGTARRATCISNLRQITHGTLLYVADYDDRLVPVNHQPATEANSRNDRTWVQCLLPYVRSFAVFRCPADYSARPRLEATFDLDLVPGDTTSQYYSASLRSNYGYNYQNLSPIMQIEGVWAARPREMNEISSPSQTIVFVDSVWEQARNSEPRGGGNWLVVPPCRYYQESIDSFTGTADPAVVYAPVQGWGVSRPTPGTTILPRYGNSFPWHEGRMNVARLDGSSVLMNPKQLGMGCDVKDAWKGRIGDPAVYPWDIR